MSYLKATKNGTSYRFSLKPASDMTSSLFPAIKTVKYTSGNNVTIPLSNTSYVSGRTYNITVCFRTRGDGDSTSSKCSSVGFIANKSDWSHSYSYIHSSPTAYAERGQIVKWTYSFTPTANETRSTALYFIVNNSWAKGADNQTIDLFYYKFWDSAGNVYDMDEYQNAFGILGNYCNEFSIKAAGTSDYQLTNTVLLTNLYVTFYAKAKNATTNSVAYITFVEGNPIIPNATYKKNIPLNSDWTKFIFELPESISETTNLYFFASNVDLYIKNVKPFIKKEFRNTFFLKSIKNNEIYYTRIPENITAFSGTIRLKNDNITYYMKQGANCYTYSELTSNTYNTLNIKFEY